MKQILFITWDGPQTSYMEGLFMPIFHEIAKRADLQFHVIQFTPADYHKTAEVSKKAESLGIRYTSFPVFRKPVASIGALISLFGASEKVKKYIQNHDIDIVMPRSTFPALMVNRIANRTFKVIFDADGLPLEERVDFAGLSKKSRLYRWMKSIETKMLLEAHAVITRSQKAVDIHVQQIGERYRSKFSVVYNGRDAHRFAPDQDQRAISRKQLGLSDETLFVYAGSLGPQYCFPQMLSIFEAQLQGDAVFNKPNAHFLILTGNTDFAHHHIPNHLKDKVSIKKVPADEVPAWLNAGDVAFALRQPSFSMQGVAPIKLGEYLLCGIPTIASKGIGDSEIILEQFQECLLYDHDHSPVMEEILKFTEKAKFADREKIRQKSLRFFSLDAAADSYLKILKKL